MGDGIVNVTYHTVPVGKPKFFFRTVKDPAYRRRTEIVTIKQDGVIDEQNYIVAPTMRGQIVEAYPCTIVTIVDRAPVAPISGRSNSRKKARGTTMLGSARERRPRPGWTGG